MSVRYGVAVIPEPSFTARVYRARQLICGQYASWAAEMHMLRLPLLEYFPCPEGGEESLAAAIALLASESRGRGGIPLAHRDVAGEDAVGGNIFLDIAAAEDPPPGEVGRLYSLQGEAAERVAQVSSLDPRRLQEGYQPRIPLMQHSSLPPPVFAGAVEFAQAVVRDLQVPQTTSAWHLALLRFESAAAGEDWEGGRWAADLRWQLLGSYPV